MLSYKFLHKRPTVTSPHVCLSLTPLKPPPTMFIIKTNFNVIVYDQGSSGSCTVNSIAACITYQEIKDFNVHFNPSRLFIYYNEIQLANKFSNSDIGLTIADGLSVIKEIGVCSDLLFPYTDDGRYPLQKTPDTNCYAEAGRYKAFSCVSIKDGDINTIKHIISQNNTIMFGTYVYESFLKLNKSKSIIFPNTKTEKLLGSHALLLVGYNDYTSTFIAQNSWGVKWGLNGFFNIPYSYFTIQTTINGIEQYLTSDIHSILNMVNPNY